MLLLQDTKWPQTTQPNETSELAPRIADMFDNQSALVPSPPILSKDSMMSVVMRRGAFCFGGEMSVPDFPSPYCAGWNPEEKDFPVFS